MERCHIGFFGLANAGKSSLVNAVTGQSLALVSDRRGTTTDPVKKAMELLPLGPVVVIDTPGLDDDTELGPLRVERAKKVLDEIHLAVVVRDSTAPGATSPELAELERQIALRSLPHIEVYTKCDLPHVSLPSGSLAVSAKTLENIGLLKEKIAGLALKGREGKAKRLVGDLLKTGDKVVMVVPIDASAPKDRIILPQQQVLRDILDAHAIASVCQPDELAQMCKDAPPRLVITDSQVFRKVASIIPDDWPLTSFSILFARYKGDLKVLVDGAKTLGELEDGDKVLISEGCTHHRQCGDIGRDKLPAWIKKFSGADLDWTFTSGGDFPEDLSPFRLIVHCGGCMLSDMAVRARIAKAQASNVPIVNYGVAIAHMNGILARAVKPF